MDIFKRGPKFDEKVVPTVLFEKVKEDVERLEIQHRISEANKNIRNLMVVNQISNTNIILNILQVIPDVEDP